MCCLQEKQFKVCPIYQIPFNCVVMLMDSALLGARPSSNIVLVVQGVVFLMWAVEVLGVFFLILEVCLKLKRVRIQTYPLTANTSSRAAPDLT